MHCAGCSKQGLPLLKGASPIFQRWFHHYSWTSNFAPKSDFQRLLFNYSFGYSKFAYYLFDDLVSDPLYHCRWNILTINSASQ